MRDIQTLDVALGERSYSIVVGAGVLARADEWIVRKLASPRVIIVSDERVAPHYAKPLAYTLIPQGIRVDTITIPAGEGSKSFAGLESLMNQLLALNPDRKTTLIALGGGVVGDLVGFAASILLRGVPFMQIPTTLLAQVDSSVGGKTAINTASGKNLVGSFYQPRLVLADTDTLATLPAREMRSGYAEIIKYGLIMDAPFYEWCRAHGADLISSPHRGEVGRGAGLAPSDNIVHSNSSPHPNPPPAGEGNLLQKAVLHSCRCKAAIVASDELEADTRALLNFGHTFGHALEAETGYGEKLLHGEAVAIGMVMACRLSARLGLIAASVEAELAAHLRALGLPASPRDIAHAWDAEKIAAHFVQDKKAENGTLTFIVLDKIGAARVAKNVDAALALDVVRSFVE